MTTLRPRKRRWLHVIATGAVLVPVVAAVMYSSFFVNQFECEVCISFDGRHACRTVGGYTREEALRGAIDNACAQIASGVTDTLRCTRTEPRKAACREI